MTKGTKNYERKSIEKWVKPKRFALPFLVSLCLGGESFGLADWFL